MNRGTVYTNKESVELVERHQHERDEEAYAFLMNDRRGRWFVMRLMQICGIEESSFTGNSGTFYNEGKRDIGLSIKRDILVTLDDSSNNGLLLWQEGQREFDHFARELQNVIQQMNKEFGGNFDE